MQCFVHQLKGTFDNESLKPFGQLKIKASSATAVSIWITSATRQNVKVLDSEGTQIQQVVLVPNERATINVSTSSYVTYVVDDAFNVTNLFCHNATQYGAVAGTDAKYEFDLRDFDGSKITSFAPEPSILLTDAENYNKPVYMPDLDTFAVSFKDDAVNIGYLGGCVTFAGMDFWQSNTKETYGEWKDVFENQCKLGRTSGTFAVGMYQQYDVNHSTFNGINISGTIFTASFSNAGCTITPGENFTMRTGYTSASYNKTTGEWTFETA